jgi:hypothetical protein
MLLPHRLVFRPSSALALWLSLLHLAALVCLLPLSIPIWLKVTTGFAVAVSFACALRRHALLVARASIRELVLKADGVVVGIRQDGEPFEAKVSGQSAVLPGLIVILLELPGSRRLHPLLVLSDSLCAEDLRILRAWLRWKLT